MSRTPEETTIYWQQAKIRPLLSHSDVRAYALREQFSQVNDEVDAPFNAYLLESLDAVTGNCMLTADTGHKRTLNEDLALNAIKETPTLVNGHYQ